MARANGVVIVSERFWAFAGVDGSLREGRMPSAPRPLRHELRRTLTARRDARSALLAARDGCVHSAGGDRVVAGRDDGALATRAGVVVPRGTGAARAGPTSAAHNDARAEARRDARRL